MKKFLILSFLGFLFSIQSAFAATGDVEGYAWGGGGTPNPAGYDGIGWISMNSTGCDTDKNTFPDVACGGNNTSGVLLPYAVNIPSSGNLSGYAWSEHYGWISFNDNGCPAGIIGECQPRRVGDDILGWARILSIRDAGVNAGGWSGWISLNGKNCDTDSNGKTDVACGGNNTNTVLQSYGLQVSKMTKRAWNDNDPSKTTYAYSDELGWIDFSTAGFDADYRICPTTLTMNEGATVSLHAYYQTNGMVDCFNTASATEVTSLVTWSSSVPAKATVGAGTGIVTGVAQGSTVVSTNQYLGKTPPGVNVTVNCPSNYASLCTAEQPKYCPTESIAITDYCGHKTGDVGYSCQGNRNCDYNFKESSP
jgi:hypothetical protein